MTIFWHNTQTDNFTHIFYRIISSYIHIGSNEHKPLLLSSLNNSHVLRSTGAGFNPAYESKGSATSVEAIKDDYLKEICSPGS